MADMVSSVSVKIDGVLSEEMKLNLREKEKILKSGWLEQARQSSPKHSQEEMEGGYEMLLLLLAKPGVRIEAERTSLVSGRLSSPSWECESENLLQIEAGSVNNLLRIEAGKARLSANRSWESMELGRVRIEVRLSRWSLWTLALRQSSERRREPIESVIVASRSIIVVVEICHHHRQDPSPLSSRSITVAVEIHHRYHKTPSLSPSRSIIVVIEILHRRRQDPSSLLSRSVIIAVKIRHCCHRDPSSSQSRSIIVVVEIHHCRRRDPSPSPSRSSNMAEVV
ncbi:uncharacterized protein G2W53_004541 [Senna tora]|uniref:Uncharacterized protein n=1 Tax=Senna tora TaxID=362788 RepID=A0A834XB73_9FABA|nr:uncharacterized protein G2W53_004541 [Senna tora]